MSAKKQMLFAYPNDSFLMQFIDIFKKVQELPVMEDKHGQFLEAQYDFNGECLALSCYARVIHTGASGSPLLIYLPWYGGKSTQFRRIFSIRKDWTCVGIDVFNTRQDFNKILATAIGSQCAYALVIRLMAEQIRATHKAHRRVGLIGFSYGANVLNAYTTQGLELPDAIVAIEGGSIVETTLKTKYHNHDSDPRTLAALKKNPGLVPLQKPVSGKAAKISAAIINDMDPVVLGQQELWGNAACKLFISGRHFTAPLLKRSKIRPFVQEHFEKLLIGKHT
jgi:hypothetical protein